MSAPRVAMRKIKDCLRLKLECGLSLERVAKALGLSKGVVAKYVTRTKLWTLTWRPLAAVGAIDSWVSRTLPPELCRARHSLQAFLRPQGVQCLASIRGAPPAARFLFIGLY